MPQLTLKKAIRETITNKLEENRLILWYDEGGTLEPIVEHTIPKNTELIKYDGSYLKIRIQIEQEEDLGKKRVIYIPTKPPKQSWIRDYELFGEKIELNLPKVLRDKFQLKTTPRASLTLTPPNCRRLARRWNEVLGVVRPPLTMEQIEEANIAALLGQPSKFNLERALLTFLEDPDDITQKLEKSGLKQVFLDILERNGLPRMEDLDASRIAAALLLSELVCKSDIDGEGFKNILPDPGRRQFWANIVHTWASNTTLLDSFFQWSQKTESQYNIKDLVIGRHGIEEVESFQAIDNALLEEIKARIDEGDVKGLLDNAKYIEKVAGTRVNKVWTREGKVKEWFLLLKSLEILKRIEKSLKEDKTKLLIDYFQHFWRIDQLFREISPYKRTIDRSMRLKIIEPVTEKYQKWLKKTNEELTDQVADLKKWPLPDIQPQTDFWKKFVKPNQKTCIFLIDALRLELQKRLVDELGRKGHKIKHIPMLASLPSITEVCMPALLPKQEFNIKHSNGSLEVLVDGETIASKKDRLKFLKNKFKDKIAFLELNDFREELQTISEKIGDADILVVSDIDIDKAGRFLSDDILEYFDNLLERIEAAVETATLLGFQKIVIATDHGFLIIPNPELVKVVEGFSEKGLVASRRYAIGKPQKCEGCITLSLRNIGYQTEGEILLPIGISYLPRKGPKEIYIHGGLSLQECCIGVIEIEPKTIGKRVGVRAETTEPISSKFVRVKLLPKTTELFPIPRTVKAELWYRDRIVGESKPIELLRQAAEVYMKLEKTQGVESVELRIVDILTKEIIYRREIEVTLGEYDDLF